MTLLTYMLKQNAIDVNRPFWRNTSALTRDEQWSLTRKETPEKWGVELKQTLKTFYYTLSIIRYSVSVSQSNYHHRVKKYEQQLKIILLKLIELITCIHFTEPIRLRSGFSWAIFWAVQTPGAGINQRNQLSHSQLRYVTV